MVGRRGSKFVALVAIALASAACFAAAVHAEGEEDTGGFGAFHLKGTNGYSILVMGISKPHFKQGEVIVWAANGHGAVVYLQRAKVTADTIETDLGAAGQLSVAFQSQGPPERVQARCKKGGVETFEPGLWVGKIEITGEEGFTTVKKTQAKAIPSPFVNAGCGISIGEETVGHGLPGVRLVARDGGTHRARYLQANQNRPGGPIKVEADLEERRGGLIIDRLIEDTYPGGGLHFDPMLRSATLSPPAPFSGSATFHLNANPTNRWIGNLTLDFPGRADVPMAGSAFKATLAHARWFAR
jgi:hypothetical protein